MNDFSKTYNDIKRLSASKQERALKLLDRAQFMDEQMLELQKILKEKGWTEHYQNGENQSGLKKSSEADVYMNLAKTFLSTMKQLEDMMADIPAVQESKLTAFLKDA